MSKVNPFFVHSRWFSKLTVYILIKSIPDVIEMSQINPLCIHFRQIFKLTIYFPICRHLDVIEMSHINHLFSDLQCSRCDKNEPN